MKETFNVVQVLRELTGTSKGITLVGAKEQKQFITYRELWNRGYFIQEILKENCIEKGREVIILCEDNENFIYALWGCIFGGYTAIPIDVGKDMCNVNSLAEIMKELDEPILICDVEIDHISVNSRFFIEDYKEQILHCKDYTKEDVIIEPNDILYVQYSSGTTKKPRGTVVTRANVEANTYSIIKHYEMDEEDRFLSISPLTHCLGLVGFHFVPIMAKAEQCLISTRLYMKKPLIWADMIDAYKATRVVSLPFALKHFSNGYQKAGNHVYWNFSTIKSLILAGEQIHYSLCREFIQCVKRYGFHRENLSPLYGLSEATLLVTSVAAGTSAKVFRMEGRTMEIGDKVTCEEVTEPDEQAHVFVEIGTPGEKIQVCIRDEEQKELEEERLGYIYVSGPGITKGYYKDKAATADVYGKDGWLNTGDIGVMCQNHLIIVGREKDLVVANGKKISCVLIEDIVQKCLKNTVYRECAVCNGVIRENESEKVIAFIRMEKEQLSDWEKDLFFSLKQKICADVFEEIGLMISEVLLVPEIPQTGSGKVFRRKLSENYNTGQYKESVNQLNEITRSEDKSLKKKYSRHVIEEKIITNIENRFHVKVMDYNCPIFEYGIVSINIPSFMEALNEEFDVHMNAGDIFTYFTVAKLSQHIASLQKKENTVSVQKVQPIESGKDKLAIVGMSCRFPGGANNVEEFWELLTSGKDGISTIPEDRWDVEKYYDPDNSVQGKAYTKNGGYLDGQIDQFDARFFNISPKEANALDPQQRILLELTWEAFENANMNIEHYNGTNTGVYVGICNNEYFMSQTHSGDLTTINPYSLTGCSWSTACGRISYTFGFEGPCAAVDTACSSALTALHFACSALQNGEADMQVVAGVNLIESPAYGIAFSKLQAIGPDGHCKSFDASANGYARGEGCGVILLKRLSDAVRDQDEILGVIRATGMNQDGKSNGLTAPNGEAQQKLISSTMLRAGVKPDDIDYVEMHGTGTKLGDPIEVNAVAAIYGKGRTKKEAVKIGSVKSNIGHLESAAGVASIIKVLLAFQHQSIPGNLHFHVPNPLIDWKNSNLEVVDHNTDWIKENGIRRAAINGFGFGGSNAHVIIEEYKPEEIEIREVTKQNGMDYILKITAQSEESLKQLVKDYYELLQKADESQTADIIYSACQGRADLTYRLLVCGSSRNALLERMKNYLDNGYAAGVITNEGGHLQKNPKIVFMYTGQGSQYINMGKMLYETNDTFRTAMEECDILFQPYLLCSILELVYGEEAEESVLERTVFAQPVIFAIEYALSQMWDELGVAPDIVMGHSIGEYAAAVTAGIMKLADAVKLVSARGRLMDMAPGHGKMATVFADRETVLKLIGTYKETVCIAAENAEESNVISGVAKDVEAVLEIAKEAGYRAKELIVSHAFHSMLMEPVLKDFYAVAKAVDYRESRIRFVSSLYGKELEPGQILDGAYWTEHIRAEVKFYQSLSSMKTKTKQNYLFLEVGSNRVLAALAKLTFADSHIIASSLSMKKPDHEYLPQEIAAVYAAGVQINWEKIRFAGKKKWKKAKLPNYPYNRKKYWMELQYDRSTAGVSANECHPVLGQRIDVAAEKETVIYQRKFSVKEPYFMSEHIIFDVSISPAAAHISMLLSALQDTTAAKSCSVRNVEFRAPLAAKEEEERQVQIYLEEQNGQKAFHIASRDNQNRLDSWLLHAKGEAEVSEDYLAEEQKIIPDSFENLTFDENIEGSIYDYMRSTGFILGDGFRRIKKIHYKENECICLIEPLKSVPHYKDYIIYPGIIDCMFQSGLALILEQLIATARTEAVNKTIIPYFIEKLTFNHRQFETLWCHTKSEIKNELIYVDMEVYNECGEMVMKVDRMLIKLTNSKSLLREMNHTDKSYYHMDWKQTEVYAPARRDIREIKTLAVSDDEASLNSLKERLTQKGADVICVLAGEKYEQKTSGLYGIDVGKRDDWSALLRTVTKAGTEKGLQVIYCSMKNKETESMAESVLYQSVKGLYHLIQVMSREGYLHNSKIKILTKEVQMIRDVENGNLSAALLWGLAKTVSIEYPELFGGIVDVDVEAFQNERFLTELLGAETKETAVRGNVKYEARLITHSKYEKKHRIKEKKIHIRKDGTYLITGGTGTLGLVYARQLVKEGARYLILTARREPGEEAKSVIKELQEQGVMVTVALGDVCNYADIKTAIEEAIEHMPSMKGIVHAAGVLHDKMLMELQWEEFNEVLQPKVMGTWNLYQMFQNAELDFFMMLSSITSVIGNMGQANYGSANYFMNRFAGYLRKQGIPGFTFCWGPWGEGGMAADSRVVTEQLERMGMKPIDLEQGQKMIEEFFAQPYETLLLADVDWNKVNASVRKEDLLSELITDKSSVQGDKQQQEDGDGVLKQLEELSSEERKEYLEQKLQELFGKIMGFGKGQLAIEEGFSEQGADSLMIFSMNAAINQLLHTSFAVSVFFDHSSIKALSEYALGELFK